MCTTRTEYACGFRDVTFSYNGEVPVLDKLTASFEAGKVHFWVGPSGSGKSTLAHLLCGILTPDAGQVFWSDHLPPALVLQFPENLFLADTVEDEIALLEDAHAEGQAKRLLTEFRLQIDDIAHKDPNRLSFGQRRMLSIALQSAQKSESIVLDEPSLGLDMNHLAVLAEWIGRLSNQGETVMIITHDLELITMLDGSVTILNQGKLSWFGAKDEFLEREDLLNLAAMA